MDMKRMTLLIVALALGVSAAWAQAKPDFSGTWKLSGTTPPNYPGSAGWGVPSTTLVVKQTATEVTIQSGQYGTTPMNVRRDAGLAGECSMTIASARRVPRRTQ